MPCCSAVGCSNRSENGFKLYAFPTNSERRKLWETKVNRPDWKSTRSSCLCQEHFAYDQFENKRADGKRKLRWNAVPTLFSDLSDPNSRKCQTKGNGIPDSSPNNNKDDSLVDHSYIALPEDDEPDMLSDESAQESDDCVQEVMKLKESITKLEKDLLEARKRKRSRVTEKFFKPDQPRTRKKVAGGMDLTKDECIKIILLCGREGWSHQKVAEHFNQVHPKRENISNSTVKKLVTKFKATGSVLDKSFPSQPNMPDDSYVSITSKVQASPKKSIRKKKQDTEVPHSNIQKFMKEEHFHPYKLQVMQHLSEDDPDRRVEMCKWFLNRLNESPSFTKDCVLFSSDATFYLNGEVKRQNMRYWSQDAPNLLPLPSQGDSKIMVWCGIWRSYVLGPYFFDERITGESYLNMLANQLKPKLHLFGEGLPKWFQHDGSPPHYAEAVCAWLNDNFTNWIGRRGTVEWAARSPDLNPIDYFFWGYLKSKIFERKIKDTEHLKQCIAKACAVLNGDEHLFETVHKNLKERVKQCIKVEGQYVEQIM